MWHVNQLVQTYLPPMAQPIMSDKLYRRPFVYQTDLDGDGFQEIIATYHWKGNNYIYI
jgi:hypothetical protein